MALLIGLDGRYLHEAGLELTAISGLIPISAQTMTHFTVRAEHGIGPYTITADEAAPVYYGRKDTPPMLVLYADQDIAARAEENEYFVAMMKGAGNPNVTGQMIHGRTHSTIESDLAHETDPARLAILDFIKAHSRPPLNSPMAK